MDVILGKGASILILRKASLKDFREKYKYKGFDSILGHKEALISISKTYISTIWSWKYNIAENGGYKVNGIYL